MEPPLGEPLRWEPARRPERTVLAGRHVVVCPLNAATDAESLYAASHPPDGDVGIWTYLPTGPYPGARAMGEWLAMAERLDDPLFFTLAATPAEEPAGVASYLRITPEHGVIEIGHIWFGVDLQRTTAASEAIFLLARHAFDQLGYRRLEWKCNALNAASRQAATRFGFNFEGVFRQHMVVKGRNRDSAWYAITDRDWPAIRSGFEAWLEPANFDPAGAQRRRLSDLISQARAG